MHNNVRKGAKKKLRNLCKVLPPTIIGANIYHLRQKKKNKLIFITPTAVPRDFFEKKKKESRGATFFSTPLLKIFQIR